MCDVHAALRESPSFKRTQRGLRVLHSFLHVFTVGFVDEALVLLMLFFADEDFKDETLLDTN